MELHCRPVLFRKIWPMAHVNSGIEIMVDRVLSVKARIISKTSNLPPLN
jgi:hypothetical protein